MSARSVNPRATSGTTGAMLAAARISKRLEPAKVADRLGVSEERLERFESGQYQNAHRDVYNLGFLRNYARLVDLDGDLVIDTYRRERVSTPKRPGAEPARAPIVTSSIFVKVLIGVILVLVLGYVGWQTLALTSDPPLSVVSPGENQTIYGSQLEVSGTTRPGNDILIDNTPVAVADDGSFRFEVTLGEGVHMLTIEARNQRGQTARVTRTVIFRDLSGSR